MGDGGAVSGRPMISSLTALVACARTSNRSTPNAATGPHVADKDGCAPGRITEVVGTPSFPPSPSPPTVDRYFDAKQGTVSHPGELLTSERHKLCRQCGAILIS